jgi:hypothetical protein
MLFQSIYGLFPLVRPKFRRALTFKDMDKKEVELNTDFMEKLIVARLIKKIPRFSRNLNVHYLFHNNPLLKSILSHLGPVHTLHFIYLIHFNIILLFMHRSHCLTGRYKNVNNCNLSNGIKI